MITFPFFKKTKNLLGIDVGTFSTKIVELSYTKKGKVTLENYGEKMNEAKDEFYQGKRKKPFLLPHQDIADNVRSILMESGIKKRDAIFSIPDFMTFFTVFRIPPMPKEEIASVVQFEAKQHIPLPMSEITLDWSIIEAGSKEKNKGPKILLVVVPNKVISEYQKVAALAGVNLLSIEAEVFSLARAAIVGEDLTQTVQLIDMGIQSTTISVVRDGLIKATYSIDFSKGEIVKNIADKLSMSYNEADRMIRKVGFVESSNDGKVLCAFLDILIDEIKQISDSFFKNEQKEIKKIILAGGPSSSIGLKDYLKRKTKKEIQIVNPFSSFSYPPVLEEALKKMGPRYAIATGLALKDKE